MNDIFMFSEAPYDTHGADRLIRPKGYITGFGINSFSYQGAKIWNVLQDHVKGGGILRYAKDWLANGMDQSVAVVPELCVRCITSDGVQL